MNYAGILVCNSKKLCCTLPLCFNNQCGRFSRRSCFKKAILHSVWPAFVTTDWMRMPFSTTLQKPLLRFLTTLFYISWNLSEYLITRLHFTQFRQGRTFDLGSRQGLYEPSPTRSDSAQGLLEARPTKPPRGNHVSRLRPAKKCNGKTWSLVRMAGPKLVPSLRLSTGTSRTCRSAFIFEMQLVLALVHNSKVIPSFYLR